MRANRPTIIIVLLCSLTLVTSVSGLVLFAMTWADPVPPAWGFRGFTAPLAAVLTVIGAVVAARRPANPIGWIYLVTGACSGIQGFVEEYRNYSAVSVAGPLPAADLANWALAWIWVPGVGSMSTFAFLLFPDGRLPSRKWRPVAVLSTVGITLMAAAFIVNPELNDPAFNQASAIPIAMWALLTGSAVLVVNGVLSASAPLVRLRRATGTERQQLKWIASAGAIMIFAGVIQMITGIFVEPQLGYRIAIDDVLLIVAMLSIPIASGIAILRYGLWEIDLIINRAIVYLLSTSILLACYVGSIVVLQRVFRAVVGEQSDLAIVISTLVIAALFLPLRRRIQALIDRRFYRRKYDAGKTLAAFSATARDEVDLEKLTTAVARVAAETLQPAHVSIWLWPSRRLPTDFD